MACHGYVVTVNHKSFDKFMEVLNGEDENNLLKEIKVLISKLLEGFNKQRAMFESL